MARRQSITPGDRFHRLVVIKEVEPTPYGNRMVLCVCDCGTERVVPLGNLKSNHTRSCGCLARESVRVQNVTHGGTGTRLYGIWANMLNRTKNPDASDYSRYGGRGITVCDEWRSFATFRAWADSHGYKPDLSIERIDVNGNYCPDNCEWIPPLHQAWNRRDSFLVTIGGETKCLAQWARHYGANYKAVWQRIADGMPPFEALTK